MEDIFMGFLKSLFTGKSTDVFKPDFTKSEYDNWMDYLDEGGTTEQWNALKIEHKWNFPKDSTEIFMEYRKEIKPISDRYYTLLEKIERDWSTLYNLKDYTSTLSQEFEQECFDAIHLFKKMHAIDIKYNETSPKNIPAFKRLAMLYERRSDYEQSVDVCKQAISLGMDEQSRMIRMIKKAGRTPTNAEMELINNENK